MPGTSAGAAKLAAARIGCSLAEYLERGGGEKHCYGCRKWHRLNEFHTDHSRRDKLAACCRRWAARRVKAKYVPVAERRRRGGE